MTHAEMYRPVLRYLWGPVAGLIYDDETVSEVLINGPNEIYCERNGKLERAEELKFPSAAALDAVVRNLAEYVGRPLDELNCTLDARMPEPEQYRIHVITFPLSRAGTYVSVRKFPRTHKTLDSLTADGTLTATAREYLELVMRAKLNALISGGTGTGKTTLLNALSSAIPADERVVVIEDSSELRLQGKHVVYLEARLPDAKGRGGRTIRDLVAESLRMRPDRIVVGEVRRGEAIDMVQAMLSGHDGTASTIHASDPNRALVRLETLCLRGDTNLPVYVAHTQVAAAVHVVVQIAKLAVGEHRLRRVTDIAEVVRADEQTGYQLRTVFHTRGGALVATGEPSQFRNAIDAHDLTKQIKLTAALFPPTSPK